MKRLTAVPDVDVATEGDADLVLGFTDDRQITLHALTPHGNRELGTFDDVREAWAAVDRIDLEELEELLAAEHAAAGIPVDRAA